MFFEQQKKQEHMMQCTKEQSSSLVAEAETIAFLSVSVNSPSSFRSYLDALCEGLHGLADGTLTRSSFDSLHEQLHQHMMQGSCTDSDLESSINRVHMLFHAIMKAN